MITWAITGLYNADPEQIFKEINMIGDQYTPEQVVEKAKDEATHLHSLFEWDDTVAAEKYRIIQAGKIIRALVYVPDVTEEEKPAPKIRAIVTNGVTNQYAEITAVAKNNDQYSRLLEEAKQDAANFMRKFKALKEFEEVFEAMRTLLEG